MNVHTYLGEVRMFAGDRAPGPDWAICDGRLLQISNYEALFTVIGTTYGGDGMSTFAVPDLRGRVPVQWGNSPAGIRIGLGQPYGSEKTSLTADNLPSHSHPFMASTATTATNLANGNFLGNTGTLNVYQAGDVTKAEMSTKCIAPAGNVPSVEISLVQAYQSINFVIALEGEYPPRP